MIYIEGIIRSDDDPRDDGHTIECTEIPLRALEYINRTAKFEIITGGRIKIIDAALLEVVRNAPMMKCTEVKVDENLSLHICFDWSEHNQIKYIDCDLRIQT